MIAFVADAKKEGCTHDEHDFRAAVNHAAPHFTFCIPSVIDGIQTKEIVHGEQGAG